MRDFLTTFFLGAFLTAAAFGCASSQPRPLPPVTPPPPQVTQARPGASLPAGWIWPLDLKSLLGGASSLASLASLRPIDVANLMPYVGKGPCSPVQVTQNVWFAPDCGAWLSKPLSQSPSVTVKSLSGYGQPLPAMVDLRAQGLDGPVKYQQMVGVCWAFAISTVMENALRRVGRPDIIAPLHVVSSDTWNELWRKGHTEHSLTLESNWPYDPAKACQLNEDQSEVWCEQAYHVPRGAWRSNPALVEEVRRADQLGIFRIAKLEKLAEPRNPDVLATILAQGQAIFADFDINTQAWGHANTSGPVIPDWGPTDGGHAVVLVGYRWAGNYGRQFLIHNSWSQEWREGGYAWVSEAMVRTHLDDAFTVEVTWGPTAPTPPTPTPQPTGQTPYPFPWPIPVPSGTTLPWAIPGTAGTPIPWPVPGASTTTQPPTSGCPAGQVPDLVLGTCSAACPGGQAPALGVCAPGQQPQQSGCPAGQVLDVLWGSCSSPCAKGQAPIGGTCWN